jgi:DnaJ like chaperone protein
LAWWGKLIGGAFGFMLGGPLGAVLGGALGHTFDKGMAGMEDALDPGERERVQTAFFTATFSVMGHLAKADGRVSSDEIALAEAIMGEMDLSPELRQTAIRLFEQGKSTDFPLDDVIDQFRRECHRRQTLIRMFLEIQLQAAYADGRLDPSEDALLQRVCGRLGIPAGVYRGLERMARAERHFAGAGGARGEPPRRGPTLEDAYAVLNISQQASDAEVKRAYRRLMSQHHPDKLVAKGLPEEMMKLATQKTHEIRQAYDKVKAARGL